MSGFLGKTPIFIHVLHQKIADLFGWIMMKNSQVKLRFLYIRPWICRKK